MKTIGGRPVRITRYLAAGVSGAYETAFGRMRGATWNANGVAESGYAKANLDPETTAYVREQLAKRRQAA